MEKRRTFDSAFKEKAVALAEARVDLQQKNGR